MGFRDRGGNPFDGAPLWAVIIILQNELILARLEQRASKLLPDDQKIVDEIFAIEIADKAAIDEAMKK